MGKYLISYHIPKLIYLGNFILKVRYKKRTKRKTFIVRRKDCVKIKRYKTLYYIHITFFTVKTTSRKVRGVLKVHICKNLCPCTPKGKLKNKRKWDPVKLVFQYTLLLKSTKILSKFINVKIQYNWGIEEKTKLSLLREDVLQWGLVIKHFYLERYNHNFLFSGVYTSTS